ncbi:acyltransferase family protein [Paractinoplanes hotanensis]|uniref:Acyltransferase n=1 Tax=Paractinoplanes hotanensis TaxID=2906497 RepID=A0ABT0Y141_9ACTN|nr:acyltransferase [Actinoplanes hotanensis]MCM4079753.1 acyltransferase [Actinoplanes hotanensis]
MPAAPRMAWLDGLRAVAVLLVLYAHQSRYVLTDARAVSAEWLHAGPAGVMLFFLVSGYIIPASLERHGSLRRFWVGRAGRLLPLYAAVALAVVVLGYYRPADPATAAVAHATMVPFLLGVVPASPVFWTLSFEMVFYLLVAALFALRLHRADSVVAVLLAVGAVLTAPLAPQAVRTPYAAAALALGLVALLSRRRWAVTAGAVVLGGLALTLVTAGAAPSHAWDGLLIVAVMFTGTTIYRADSGRTGWWPVAVVAPVVAAGLLFNWSAELVSLDALTPRYVARAVITLLVFAGAFAAGLLTRRWRTPRWLAWIGVVSYSVYLNHYVLLLVMRPLFPAGLGLGSQFALGLAYLCVVFATSWVTHRYLELPGQRWARRMSDVWDEPVGVRPPHAPVRG